MAGPWKKKRRQRERLSPQSTVSDISGTTVAFLDAGFLEHERQRTETGHGALRQIHATKAVSQSQAGLPEKWPGRC